MQTQLSDSIYLRPQAAMDNLWVPLSVAQHRMVSPPSSPFWSPETADHTCDMASALLGEAQYRIGRHFLLSNHHLAFCHFFLLHFLHLPLFHFQPSAPAAQCCSNITNLLSFRLKTPSPQVVSLEVRLRNSERKTSETRSRGNGKWRKCSEGTPRRTGWLYGV